MDLDRFDKCWFALQVKPRYEFLAACSLRSKGFEELLPTYKSKRQWSDRRKVVELPLFPGYVFCRFNAQIRVPILTTPGVIRVVGTNLTVSTAEIEAIQAIVARGIPASPCSYLKVGTRVEVIAGPLAGIRGILVSHSNQYRLILSVTLVQSSVSVEVEHSDVRPVPENAHPVANVEQRILCGKVMPAMASQSPC